MFVLAGIVSAVSWVVRYRILNMYSRLPPEPQRQEPEIDLFPDTHEESTKAGFSSYLDEFLSAIKIFGYLERPVFHELTRSMQTRKLIAGETINLEEEQGFCIVVDGLVEIFVKSGRQARSRANAQRHHHGGESSDEFDEDSPPEQLRYQLLTEVRNGAPMSSLFSIMSLFTEDINLQSALYSSAPAAEKGNNHLNASFAKHANARDPSSIPVSMPSTPQFDGTTGYHLMRNDGTGRHASAFGNAEPSKIPPISLDGPADNHHSRPGLGHRYTSGSAHPDIIARATVDTTIAIIPASAFRRLIKIYPKATAHIVHVILSRFQRVTLSQAFNYLGLTADVLQTEKSMIRHTMCQLPNLLRGEPLERLKEKFTQERERVDEDESKGIALHNSGATRRRRSSTYLRKDAMLQSLTRQRQSSMIHGAAARKRDAAVPPTPGPGDLVTHTQLARTTRKVSIDDSPISSPQEASKLQESESLEDPKRDTFVNTPRSNRMTLDARESANEEDLFRASTLECMFKSMGLEAGSPASREPESIEGSPRLVSSDQRRLRPLHINNAFGSMGPYDGFGDGETESVTSGSLVVNTPPSPQTLSQDMKDEVEIVFFPEGSVLVEQGERSPGLYYVIDGFLDIGSTSDDNPVNMFQTARPESFDIEPHEMEQPRMEAFANLARSEAGTKRAASQKRSTHRRNVALIKPGGLAGYIGSVSSYRSFVDVVAKTDVYVGFLPRASLERIVDKYPIILLTMAKRLTHILPRLILHIDFALEWVQVNAGQIIYRDDDESDAIYIVLNGRLRLVEDKEGGGVTALAEFGQGDSVGELEVLTETARSGTLHAIRETEMVKFPRTLFNSLAQEHPNITIKISKIIASRMRAAVDDSSKYSGKEAGSGAINNQRKSTMNLRTVAILPVTTGVPVVEFGNRLMNALAQVGPVNGAVCLHQAEILNHLGKHAFNKMGKLRLSQYLADLEEKYGLIVYVAGKIAAVVFFLSCKVFYDEQLLPRGIAVDGYILTLIFS